MDHKKLRAEAAEHAAKARAVLDGAKGRDLTDREIKIYDSNYEAAISKAAQADRMQKAADQDAYLARFANSADEHQFDNIDGSAGWSKSTSPQGKGGKADGTRWAREVTQTLAKTADGVGTKALLSGQVRTPSAVAVVELPTLPTKLLDLIPREALSDTNTFSYLRQVARTERADVVADFALKPTSDYEFEEVEDRCRVVAHLSAPMPIRYLSDHASLMRVLSTQLQGGVERALERQVVSGTGAGEQFTGLFSTTGVRQVAYTTGILETLRHASTVMGLAGEAPNAIVVNPADAEVIDLMREAGTTGGFLVNDAVASRIFGEGVARVQSNAVPQGQAVLGDWNLARLIVREDASTLAATQGSGTVNGETVDLFDHNLAKLRAEGRYGFQVLRPGAFAVVDLTA